MCDLIHRPMELYILGDSESCNTVGRILLESNTCMYIFNNSIGNIPIIWK